MKEITRRAFILGGVSSVILGTTNISEISSRLELDNRHTLSVAHNASDSPKKFEDALNSNSDFVELDLTVVDEKIVAAHDIDSHLQRTDEEKELLSPEVLLGQIKKARKGVMIDLKPDVIDMSQLQQLGLTKEAMVSSKNHALLLNLRKNGFEGTILFSIDSNSSLRNFLTTYDGEDYSSAELPYGVSIRHSLLWGNSGERLSRKLKSMGLLIAAWTPNTKIEIAAAAKNSNIIISDNYKSF